MSTAIQQPPRRRRLLPFAAAAGALVASGLVLAPPASADDAPAASLQWQVSEYFATSFSLKTHDLADGATQDGSGVVTFPEASGAYDPDSGAGTVHYTGSVTGKQVSGDATLFSVTIADPTVSVDGAGHGTVSALVSAVAPGASTDPARVVVTTFSSGADSWTTAGPLSTLAATPDWDGVLPADSDRATALGIPAGQPVDGESFAPSLLAQVPSSVRAFFYSSGSNPSSDAMKDPAPLAAATDHTVHVAITDASAKNGVTVHVTGTGFDGQTNPGDDGVYLGIAPAGGLPDVSAPGGIANFAGVAWVPASVISGGQLSATITAPAASLDKARSYAVYTWQAHTHSNTSQDTETALPIDFDALKPVPKVTIGGAHRTPYGAKARVTVTVPDSTGTVRLTGAGPANAKHLKNGAARFALPRTLAVGAHALTVSYAGDGAHAATTKTRRLTVTKAATKVRTAVTRKATSKRSGTVKVTVISKPGGGHAPQGKVRLRLVHGSKHRTVTGRLHGNGVVKLALPRLAAGSWRVTAKYAGDVRHKSTSHASDLVVGSRR
jgi:hypothetical protein